MNKDELDQLRGEYLKQPNACTAYPILYVLQELTFVGVIDDSYGYNSDGEIKYMYSYDDWGEAPFKDKDSCVKSIREYHGKESRQVINEKINSISKLTCLYIWIDVEVFLTRKGGEDYLLMNRHNLGKTRFYVKHISRRNQEMRDVLGYLGLKIQD